MELVESLDTLALNVDGFFGVQRLVEPQSSFVLPFADLETRGCAVVILFGSRALGTAGIASSVAAGAVLKAALLPRAVLAPRPENVGADISHVSLRKAGDKVVSFHLATADCLFEHVCRDALVVARDQGVVGLHGSSMRGKPGQHANVLAVRGSLKLERRHVHLDRAIVMSAGV